MRPIVWALIFSLLVPVLATASIQDGLMALRLENLKSTMNARDYDLALYRVRQIDVLERACRRETEKRKIPFSCFELRKTQVRVNTTANRRIFEIQSLETLNQQCISALSASAGDITHGDSNNRRGFQLTPECRELYIKKTAIETYKRTGRRIE